MYRSARIKRTLYWSPSNSIPPRPHERIVAAATEALQHGSERERKKSVVFLVEITRFLETRVSPYLYYSLHNLISWLEQLHLSSFRTNPSEGLFYYFFELHREEKKDLKRIREKPRFRWFPRPDVGLSSRFLDPTQHIKEKKNAARSHPSHPHDIDQSHNRNFNDNNI